MLRISTKGRYALRIMIAMVNREGTQPARKQDIAQAEGMSADYVEQILMRLKTGGMVQSHRGARGGFSLARDPNGITVREVLETTEGRMTLAPCEEEECRRASACVARRVWDEATGALNAVFDAHTVGDLAAMARNRAAENSHYFMI